MTTSNPASYLANLPREIRFMIVFQVRLDYMYRRSLCNLCLVKPISHIAFEVLYNHVELRCPKEFAFSIFENPQLGGLVSTLSLSPPSDWELSLSDKEAKLLSKRIVSRGLHPQNQWYWFRRLRADPSTNRIFVIIMLFLPNIKSLHFVKTSARIPSLLAYSTKVEDEHTNPFRMNGLARTMHPFPNFDKLEQVKLYDRYLSPSGLAAIFRLPVMKCLHVSFERDERNPKDLNWTPDMFARGTSTITEFKVTGSINLYTLARMMQACKSVTRFCHSFNGNWVYGEMDFKVIGDALGAFTETLRELSITDFCYGTTTTDCKAIEGFQSFTKLESLVIDFKVLFPSMPGSKKSKLFDIIPPSIKTLVLGKTGRYFAPVFLDSKEILSDLTLSQGSFPLNLKYIALGCACSCDNDIFVEHQDAKPAIHRDKASNSYVSVSTVDRQCITLVGTLITTVAGASWQTTVHKMSNSY